MGTAEQVLTIARAELGTKESPANSNRVKYNDWYYGRAVQGDAYPWCMVFVQWCFAQAGVSLSIRTASCGALMQAAKKAGCWVTKGFRPGDVVIYDFPGGAATDHTGIVERVTAQRVTAIEGNTSDRGSQSNGGQVCRKDRPYSQIVGCVRPDYGMVEMEDDNMNYYKTLNDVPSYYKDAVQKAVDKKAMTGDQNGALNVSEDLCRTLTVLNRLGKLD